MQTEAHCDEHNLDFITTNLCPACIKKYGPETERDAGSESRSSEWLDALTKNIESRKEEARRLEEQFKNSEADGTKWRDYFKGRQDGLAEILQELDWLKISASNKQL